jgi:drug/metabolite transporter (DMT)-like permease
MSRRSWLQLLALGSLWGASYLFIKVGLRDFSPATLVFLRIALGALVLLPLALRTGVLRQLRGRGRDIAVLAATQVAAPFVLIALGERSISSSLAGILVSSVPILTALVALRADPEERVGGWGLAGVALGIVGVALVVGIDVSGSGLLGALAVVLASLGYAIGGLFLKHRLRGVPPVALTTGTLAASALMVAPAALATLPTHAPAAGNALAVAALGFGGTGVAFVIFYRLIAEVGPSKASLVTYVVPGFALAYGALLLGEAITLATLIGLALIVGGSWLAVEGRLPAVGRAAA